MDARRTVATLAAMERNAPVEPWEFEQRSPRPRDVVLEVLYCGICHTDLHMIGPWGSDFPMVPGHELVGRVLETGSDATRHAIGDIVAVSTIVESCGVCEPCRAGLETYCLQGPTPTYGARDRLDGTPTRGGYAEQLVCDERFAYAVPAGLDLAGTAPLLCAGITTYAPLRHWNVGAGTTVGVVGIGGLGHLGVKFARALGAEVVAFTSSASKTGDALRLGAHEVVVSGDDAAMTAQANRLDFILDTVSAPHALDPFLRTLRLDGTLCSLGLPPTVDATPMTLAVGRRSIAGSGAGGSREITDMLAFCAEHGITADVELVRPDGVQQALERLGNNDVRFRFVIDRT
jgi:uncharacterized zinc-type alcohol dehydrogenase-like protein